MADVVDPVDASLAAAVTRLSPNQRAAVVLCWGDGLSAAEAADAIGCSAATVRVHLHRARRSLAAALDPTRRGGRMTPREEVPEAVRAMVERTAGRVEVDGRRSSSGDVSAIEPDRRSGSAIAPPGQGRRGHGGRRRGRRGGRRPRSPRRR